MDELRSQLRSRDLRRDAPLAGVALGIVLVASLVMLGAVSTSRPASDPLTNTYSSPEALADAVIGAIAEGDLERLRGLALTEQEFRTHVWPDLPASRSDGLVPFDFVWGNLQQNSESFLRQTVAAQQGELSDLRRVTFAGTTTTYGDVVVHRDTVLVVASAGGGERMVRLFGSLVEQQGAWKVFSYVVND